MLHFIPLPTGIARGGDYETDEALEASVGQPPKPHELTLPAPTPAQTTLVRNILEQK
jgi:hypothetical protein